uniref:Putative secreted peptide n=1 Tax=Anopheles braziliensis TaxID=58242 RepID=A0A2M3ZEC4_9DIPT
MNLPLAATPAAWKLVMVGLVLAMAASNSNSSSSNTIISLRPHVEANQKPLLRNPRGLGLFQKVAHLGSLLYQQYNDTTYTLKNVYDLLSNEFTDTYTTTTPDPHTSTTQDPSTSTTPKYRISRAELGRILNRNYRGLQKLFRLEWNDAWNQTKYNIDDYKRELKNSAFPPPNRTATAPGPLSDNHTVQVGTKLKGSS